MLTHNKDIVIRPSGVWDTRSPLIAFNKNNQYINKIYYSSILAITKVQSECTDIEVDYPVSKVFSNKKKNPIAGRAWTSFKRSFPSSLNGSRISPTISDLQKISTISIRAITEYSIIKHGALFESFAQCWALNMLLTHLESGKVFTRKERELCQKFAPKSKKHFIPGWPAIYKAFPHIRESLMKVPHIKTHTKTGCAIEEPITPALNAFSVINFWRDWRNSLVHKSGMVSTRFFDRNADVWNDMQHLFPTNIEIKAGERLPLNTATFQAVTVVHTRAAQELRKILVKESNERRGHVHAPNKAWDYDKKGPMPPEMLPIRFPPMLMDGDHKESYLWANDDSFRSRIKNEGS